jgi:hypothetical protein
MRGLIWLLAGTWCASALAVACSDENAGPNDPSNGGGNSQAGAAGSPPSNAPGGTPPASGGSGSMSGTTGSGASSGDAPAGGFSGEGGVGGAASSSAGEGGGLAWAGQGGQGGDAVPNAGEGGGGASSLPSIACPAIGQTVTYRAFDTHTDEVYAAAARLGCPLLDERDLTIRRFQVASPSIFVAYAGHSNTDFFEAMRLDDDCGTTGTVAPASTNPFVTYPSMVVERVTPGIYTSVSCGTRVETLLEAPAPAPTNVDCAHAKPLSSSKLSESRIVDEGSRFYRVTVNDPDTENPGVVKSELEVSFVTAQTNANAIGTLTGLTTAYPANTDELPYLLDFTSLIWSDLKAGDYCLEIEATPGSKFQISALANGQF